MINGAAMPLQIAVKPSSHLSFYQSFYGPEPTPNMANMLLDDITISK
jgi:hypothetical protein